MRPNPFYFFGQIHFIFLGGMSSSISARVSEPEVEDPTKCATMKVKYREQTGEDTGVTKENNDATKEKVEGCKSPRNFREALLNVPGLTGDDEMDEDLWNDEDLPENRWYKEVEEPGQHEIGKDGVPIIHVSDKDLADWSKPWEDTLVVNVLGKKVNYKVLENKINRDWARKGTVKIIDMPRGFYAVQFGSKDDYKHVLFQGPWMVADHYIMVQRWRPNFIRSATKESKVAVWLRIPELPLELYNDNFLKRLGNVLGKFLKIDRLTSVHSRGQFARICVEMDLAKPLIPKILVRGETLSLAYEGLHSVCFKCGVYGHRMEVCMKNQEVVQFQANKEAGEAVPMNLEKRAETLEHGEKETPRDGDGETTPSPRVAAQETKVPVVEADSVHRATEQEMGREVSIFGPWMLTKRNWKKKEQVVSLGLPRGVATGKRKNPVSKGNTDTGSRYTALTSLEETKDSDEGVRRVKERMDAPTEERVVEVEFHNQSQGAQPGPSLTKIRNKVGGKNPQLGPTVRETKKLARSSGPYDKSSKQLQSHLPSKAKENLISNEKGINIGGVASDDVSEIAMELLKQHKLKMVRGPIEKPLVPLQSSCPMEQDPVEDMNPLLGFIEPGDFGNKTEIVVSNGEISGKGEAEVLQQDKALRAPISALIK